MNAEIIAVGSELLTPQKVDTNSLWLTDQLNRLGVEVVLKSVVGDDRGRLAEVVAASLARSQIVLLTGGLGPTEDDVTRDAVALALGRTQSFRPDLLETIAQRFAQMNRTMAEINRRQAYLIDGAEPLPNSRGTAPGQWIELDGPRVVILLPGPPGEMKSMWDAHVLARLRALIPPLHIATAQFRVAGMGESDLDQLIAPVYTAYSNPVTTILAAPGDVQIHLRARAASREEAEALVAELGARLRELLQDRIYSDDGANLETAVGRLLIARQATLSVAESCTGGLLGQRITSVPGASACFVGGFQVYTGAAKQKLLDVPAELLARHTAVSEPVARLLAERARERTGSTWALSVTGYAGPEGAEPGLVFVGLAGPGGTEVRRVKFLGDRERVRVLAATAALDLLRRALIQ